MPSAVKERRQKERSENTTVVLEVSVLIVGAVGLIAAGFIHAFDLITTIPYLSEIGLAYTQIGLALLVALAGLGLMYKGVSLSRQLKHARRAVADLRNLADVRETFIGMAEHRLRTPISGIRWGTSALQESNNLTDEEYDILGKVKEQAQKANDLLEKLLRLQHFELDDFQLSEKKDVCDLNELIKSILEDLDFVKNENNVSVSFDDSVKFTVPCDKYLLRSSLTNVLDNAIRYSPKGEVKVMLQPEKGAVRMVISDSGIGMSPVELDHVFDRFYRGEEAQKIAPHETGLGMYLTKQVIGLHGGSIHVSSVKGNGTTTTIILPLD